MTNKIMKLFPVILITTLYMFIANFILYKKTSTQMNGESISLFGLVIDLMFGGKSILGGTALNGPIWYIGVYLICIALAFFLNIKSKKYGDKVYLIPIILAIFIEYKLLAFFPILNGTLARGFFAFFVGIYLGKYLTLFNDFSLIKKIIIKILMLYLIFLFVWVYLHNELELFYTPPGFTYILLVFTPIMILLYDIKFLNKLFGMKFFKFLGDISYSIYICNIINISFFSVKFFLIFTAIHMVVGILSNLLIEKKLSDKLIEKKIGEKVVNFFNKS